MTVCRICVMIVFCFCFKQKTAYEMRISDWSSDVCSSDLVRVRRSSAGGERGCRGRGPYRLVPGLPARVGKPPPGGRSVRRLAHRCAASDDIAAGAPCASHRRGEGATAGAAAVTAVGRAGMGTGRARDRMQAPRKSEERGGGKKGVRTVRD